MRYCLYNLRLNEAGKNLAANRPGLSVWRIPAPQTCGANAKNRAGRFFARFPLGFVALMQYAG